MDNIYDMKYKRVLQLLDEGDDFYYEGEVIKAIKSYKLALGLDKYNIDALINLGDIYFDLLKVTSVINNDPNKKNYLFDACLKFYGIAAYYNIDGNVQNRISGLLDFCEEDDDIDINCYDMDEDDMILEININKDNDSLDLE